MQGETFITDGDWELHRNRAILGKYFTLLTKTILQQSKNIVAKVLCRLCASFFRYLLIMDEVQHNEKLDELIKKQMSQNLPISILHSGEWGSYRHIISKNNSVENGHHLSSIR